MAQFVAKHADKLQGTLSCGLYPAVAASAMTRRGVMTKHQAALVADIAGCCVALDGSREIHARAYTPGQRHTVVAVAPGSCYCGGDEAAAVLVIDEAKSRIDGVIR